MQKIFLGLFVIIAFSSSQISALDQKTGTDEAELALTFTPSEYQAGLIAQKQRRRAIAELVNSDIPATSQLKQNRKEIIDEFLNSWPNDYEFPKAEPYKADPIFQAAAVLTCANLCARNLLDEHRHGNIITTLDRALIVGALGVAAYDIKEKRIDKSAQYLAGAVGGMFAFGIPIFTTSIFDNAGFVAGGVAGGLLGVGVKAVRRDCSISAFAELGAWSGMHIGIGFGFGAGALMSTAIVAPEVIDAGAHLKKKYKEKLT